MMEKTEREQYAETAWAIETLYPERTLWLEIVLCAAKKLAAGEEVSETERSMLDQWESSIAGSLVPIREDGPRH